jgi:hypothetical protein
MALIRGIHIIADGEPERARLIAEDIRQNERLRIGPGAVFGVGAYAWYEERLPNKARTLPQVLFEVDDSDIEDLFSPDGTKRGFFLIPGAMGFYVTIRVIELLNV